MNDDIVEETIFDNINKGICIVCGLPVSKGRVTCSEKCHKEFIKFCEMKYGATKKVVDTTTGIAYKVPTIVIIEKGLSWADLAKFPRWEEE